MTAFERLLTVVGWILATAAIALSVVGFTRFWASMTWEGVLFGLSLLLMCIVVLVVDLRGWKRWKTGAERRRSSLRKGS